MTTNQRLRSRKSAGLTGFMSDRKPRGTSLGSSGFSCKNLKSRHTYWYTSTCTLLHLYTYSLCKEILKVKRINYSTESIDTCQKHYMWRIFNGLMWDMEFISQVRQDFWYEKILSHEWNKFHFQRQKHWSFCLLHFIMFLHMFLSNLRQYMQYLCTLDIFTVWN